MCASANCFFFLIIPPLPHKNTHKLILMQMKDALQRSGCEIRLSCRYEPGSDVYYKNIPVLVYVISLPMGHVHQGTQLRPLHNISQRETECQSLFSLFFFLDLVPDKFVPGVATHHVKLTSLRYCVTGPSMTMPNVDRFGVSGPPCPDLGSIFSITHVFLRQHKQMVVHVCFRRLVCMKHQYIIQCP